MASKVLATVTTLIKNSKHYLFEVPAALDDLDEILLLDNGSTDRTLEVVAKFRNISIRKHEFIGLGPIKNPAARLARNDWIFNISNDEVADIELMKSAYAAMAENRMQKAFSLSHLNHYDDRLMKAYGRYPDIIPCLYHRRFTQFLDRQVHGSLKLPENAETQILVGHLKHYSFEDAEGLIRRIQQCSTFHAKENHYKKPASPVRALLYDGTSLVKNYFLKCGFAYGSGSLIASAANTQGSHYKYIKLYGHNRYITAALVITTYSRPDALELALKSAPAQTRLPDETIVAGGGSVQGTAEVVDALRRISPVPMRHSWRPDDGFCAAESRNRAIATAPSGYIILINDDMLLDPPSIADRLKFVREDRLIQGSRTILTEERTATLFENSGLPALSCFSTGIRRRVSALRLRLPMRIAGSHSNRKHRGIKTHNMGFFRGNVLAVNSFGNEFVSRGRRDSELVACCYHAGMKRHNPKSAGVTYHLWHHEAEHDSLSQNGALP